LGKDAAPGIVTVLNYWIAIVEDLQVLEIVGNSYKPDVAQGGGKEKKWLGNGGVKFEGFSIGSIEVERED
jgi:hypothetical protein